VPPGVALLTADCLDDSINSVSIIITYLLLFFLFKDKTDI